MTRTGALLDVLVVEDDPALLAGYTTHLAHDNRLRLVGSFARGREALEQAGDLMPHVALVDLGLPDIDGIDLIRGLRQRCMAMDVLVVSVFGTESHLLAAIEAGATGYLLKDTRATDFNAAIHAVHRGESPISPSLARHLLRRCQAVTDATIAPTSNDSRELLTTRENHILAAISRGDSPGEIAMELFISLHTVQTHVKNIYRKLEAHSRVEAIVTAQKRGILGR